MLCSLNGEYQECVQSLEHSEEPFEGKSQFLEDLYFVQLHATGIPNTGRFSCSVCGSKCSAREYRLNGWTWPAAYAHGVDEHNLVPTQEFREFILQQKERHE